MPGLFSREGKVQASPEEGHPGCRKATVKKGD